MKASDRTAGSEELRGGGSGGGDAVTCGLWTQYRTNIIQINSRDVNVKQICSCLLGNNRVRGKG